MLVYRISKERFINDLSGKGAELAGGRWKSKGIPAVYTSSSLAVCMCEILVHTDKYIPPTDMCFAEIFVPDEMISDEYFSSKNLDSSVLKGTEWLKSRTSLALKVPPAVLPESYSKDFNIIINPLHKDIALVHIESVCPLVFDTRLFK